MLSTADVEHLLMLSTDDAADDDADDADDVTAADAAASDF